MTATLSQDVLDPAVLAIVCATATRLSRNYGFSPADRDDIGQELLLDCVIRLRKFDPTKSSRSTFVHRIVRHRVAALIEGQTAACRDYRRCRDSLDSPALAAADEPIPLGVIVSTDDCDAWTGGSVRSSWERAEIRIDIDRVISLLSPDLASIAALLKSLSAVETGRRLGLSRATTYRRIAEIRRIFEAADLDNYARHSVRNRPQRRAIRPAPHPR